MEDGAPSLQDVRDQLCPADLLGTEAAAAIFESIIVEPDEGDEQDLQQDDDVANSSAASGSDCPDVVAATSSETYLEALEAPGPVLLEPKQNFFTDLDGVQVGVLHKVNAKSWKATCKRHKPVGSCVCWVSLKEPTDESLGLLREELVRWLKQYDVSSEAHESSARELKVAHGMRVRR